MKTLHEYIEQRTPIMPSYVLSGGQPDDAVNHPKHYTSHPAKCKCGESIECIDVTKHMNFCLGNATKYIWRAGLKNDAVEDLEKAIAYLKFEIERIKNA
jgi:hypothetical protein